LNLANLVTLVRLALIPLVILFIFLGYFGLAAILGIIIFISDYIDGYIARRFNQITDFGKLIDPLVDKIAIITVAIALVAVGRADSIPVIIITARELLVQGIRISIAQRKQKIIEASLAGKLKANVQGIALFMLILGMPYGDWMLWLAALVTIYSGGEYLWQSNLLKQLKLS
jgi:CDP-diacylglycerol--glycerol-3-phosphate 3-phosphatidyltransferase